MTVASVRCIVDRLHAASARSASPAIDASLSGRRGIIPAVMPGHVAECPNCGHHGWHVGRVTAECAACHLPLPIAADRQPMPPFAGDGPARMTPIGAMIDWIVNL